MIRRIVRRIKAAQHDLQEARRLPEPTFDVVQLALAWFIRSGQEGAFVQIGACDGATGDPVHELVASGKVRAILMEPIPATFQKLAATYDGTANVTLVQAAVGDRDGSLNLFKVKEGATSIEACWAFQLASFDKQHLVKHGVKEVDIETLAVPSLTLETLIAQNGIGRIGFLQVDTEGYDAEVVRMALRLAAPPPFINFENVHLAGGPGLDQLFEQLTAAGYSWVHDKWNTLAIHQSAVATLR